MKRSLIILISFLAIGLFAKEIQIISFNDFHGQVKPTKGFEGAAKFVKFIKNFKKDYPNTLVVSGGDNYQGNILSNLSHGEITNKIFKQIGLDYSAVGNHEFDWGIKYFSKWEKDGGFKYLACNIIDKKTNKEVSWAKPYAIKDVDGTKIAFIGIASEDTVNTTLKKNIEDYNFIKPEKAVQKWIDYLKAGKDKQGTPDVIIGLSHLPVSPEPSSRSDLDDEVVPLLESIKGLDLLLCGHNHQFSFRHIGGIPVLETNSDGNKFAIVTINMEDGKKEDISIKKINLRKISSLSKDEDTVKIVKGYVKSIGEKTKKIISKANHDIDEKPEGIKTLSPIGAFICKIVNDTAKSDVTILNNGGFRDSIQEGNVTYADVYNVLPFDNTIVTMKLTGAKLKEQIEHSITKQGGDFYGVRVTYDTSKPEGERITSLKLINGANVEDGKTYKVAINNFMLTGGDEYNFDGGKNIKDTQLSIRDAALKYIESQKVISPINTSYLKKV